MYQLFTKLPETILGNLASLSWSLLFSTRNKLPFMEAFITWALRGKPNLYQQNVKSSGKLKTIPATTTNNTQQIHLRWANKPDASNETTFAWLSMDPWTDKGVHWRLLNWSQNVRLRGTVTYSEPCLISKCRTVTKLYSNNRTALFFRKLLRHSNISLLFVVFYWWRRWKLAALEFSMRTEHPSEASVRRCTFKHEVLEATRTIDWSLSDRYWSWHHWHNWNTAIWQRTD